MGRKAGGGRQGSGRDHQTVAGPRAVADKLRVIATHRRETILAVLLRVAGPAVDREYAKAVAEMNAAFQSQEG